MNSTEPSGKEPSARLTSNLVVFVEDEEPVQYVLNADRVRLGRSPKNQICLKSRTVSASHLVFRQLESGGYEMSDMGSSNGVRVNGRRVKRHIMKDLDRLLIGGSVSAFYLVLPEDAEVEEYLSLPENGDQSRARRFFELAERRGELGRAMKNHHKRAEGLRLEIGQLRAEQHRRLELCQNLAKLTRQTLTRIRATDWSASKTHDVPVDPTDRIVTNEPQIRLIHTDGTDVPDRGEPDEAEVVLDKLPRVPWRKKPEKV